ncbi:MAG: phytase [Thiobacillaceae bacterium]
MTLKPNLLAAALTLILALPAQAIVLADRETPNIGGTGDADDPAVWLHPTDLSKSLIITAVKNGGGRVYDLGAAQIQVLSPFPVISGTSRINNVDVQYHFRLYDGSRVDIAVGSDRGQDVFRVWRIDADNPALPLAYIGSASPTRAFVDKPDGSFNPVSQQNTAYGMTLYRDVSADRFYVLATQRSQPRLAQFELVALEDGSVDTRWIRDWIFPSLTLNGTNFDLSGKQFEGLVVDQQTGILYAGQEDVGIWRIDLKSGLADASPFVLTTDYDPGSPLSPDVEGLTIYYGANGTGYLLASSQGNDSFALFNRQSLAYMGSFTVAAGGGIDAVQESDGADVVSIALPGYPYGLFITQDGDNSPEGGTNFKYVPWGAITSELGLQIDTQDYDPRNPLSPIPEPGTWAMLLAGLGLLGLIAGRRQG